MDPVSPDMKFDISLYACDEGDCLKIEIAGSQNAAIFMSPRQARAFASELIQTVYRAEVKNSLQKKQQSASLKNMDNSNERFSPRPHAA